MLHEPATLQESSILNPFYAPTYAPDRPRTGATKGASRDSIAGVLTPGDILLDLDVPTKERALEEIARFVGARNSLLCEDVQASLVARARRSDPRAWAAALRYRMRV